MMRTIHPAYVLGLLIVILMTLVWQNNNVQSEIAFTQSERANARVMAKRIIDLKKVMKTANRSQIDRFLDGSLFAGAELRHRVKSKRYIVDAKNMNARQLQAFLNRILNMTVKVMQLKIESKDEKHATLYMEISL